MRERAGIGESGLEDVVIFLKVAGDEDIVEDCHVVFAYLQNTGFVVSLLIAARHINQYNTKEKI